MFKFTRTVTGRPPLRRDLLQTLTRGLPGSSMPDFHLVPERRRDLVEYVRHHATCGELEELMVGVAWDDEEVLPDPELMAQTVMDRWDPDTLMPESIVRGREVYFDTTTANCVSCPGHRVRTAAAGGRAPSDAGDVRARASRRGGAGASGAFAFGLATAPGLALARAGAQLASARLRRVAPVVLGVALVAFGVWTVVRGTAASGTACCEEAALSGATVERRHGPSFGEAARIEASARGEGEGQELPPVAVSSRREDQGHVLRRSRLLRVRLETAGGGPAPARRPSRCSAGTADPPRPEVRGAW